MRLSPYFLYTSLAGFILSGQLFSQQNFRVAPYLQEPAPDAMSVIWFSGENSAGQCSFWKEGTVGRKILVSDPKPAEALAYSEWEDSVFFGGNAPATPYKHHLRIEGLEPETNYRYTVHQGHDSITSNFRTAPGKNAPTRFMVYADSETEPESTGKQTSWTDPVQGLDRDYPVDQTSGYHNNLVVMESREPDLIFIAGDLVESGGEQRDWDEFWWHNTGTDDRPGPALHIPLVTTPGNHEYYAGPQLGRYTQPGSDKAISKYQTYFETSTIPSTFRNNGRYHFLRYGPAIFIMLDGCNNGINGTGEDTNFSLLGEQDLEGGNAPDFGPGSRQYQWLDSLLRESRMNSIFTFVFFHHAPYSSGPHGFPAGTGTGFDGQSGQPLRQLTPLLMHYGVNAVFSGHDEMWERSVVTGVKTGPGGEEIPHSIHFFDVGIGGDGLRGPSEGAENPFREFLVHTDVPEEWKDSILIAGGKHYGHLEVDLIPEDDSVWHAILKPVYIFPLYDSLTGTYPGFERRVYDDTVVLSVIDSKPLPTAKPKELSEGILVFPNPFKERVCFEFTSPPGDFTLEISDMAGRTIHLLRDYNHSHGLRHLEWDGFDLSGSGVPSGLYLWKIHSVSGVHGRGRICRVE